MQYDICRAGLALGVILRGQVDTCEYITHWTNIMCFNALKCFLKHNIWIEIELIVCCIYKRMMITFNVFKYVKDMFSWILSDDMMLNDAWIWKQKYDIFMAWSMMIMNKNEEMCIRDL
jgi:hypothetical protein